MKSVTFARFERYILPVCPNARIETRNGVEVVVIPTYDPTNDVEGEVVHLLQREEGDTRASLPEADSD